VSWVILTIPGEYLVGYYVEKETSISIFKTTDIAKAIRLVNILNGANTTEKSIIELLSSEDLDYIKALPDT
jgi:hypothetical protein